MKRGQFRAITCDNREIASQCNTKEEAENLLLKQPTFALKLNDYAKYHQSLRNFFETWQIFPSLEDEINCSPQSYLKNLHFLPEKVTETLKQECNGNEPTFDTFLKLHENNSDRLFSITQNLMGKEGIEKIYTRVNIALQRAKDIHGSSNENFKRGILVSKKPFTILGTNRLKYIMDAENLFDDVELGSLMEFEACAHNQTAINCIFYKPKMTGFKNYIDIQSEHFLERNANKYNKKKNYQNNSLYTTTTLIKIIQKTLQQRNSHSFNIHELPVIIQKELKIEWNPRKFGYNSLKHIFSDKRILQICSIEATTGLTIVCIPEKAKETPDLSWVKAGIVQLLKKYGNPNEGYRIKNKKTSSLRKHFAKVTGRTLKPKTWFRWSIATLLKKCQDVIHIDTQSESDGVWKLYLKQNCY